MKTLLHGEDLRATLKTKLPRDDETRRDFVSVDESEGDVRPSGASSSRDSTLIGEDAKLRLLVSHQTQQEDTNTKPTTQTQQAAEYPELEGEKRVGHESFWFSVRQLVLPN